LTDLDLTPKKNDRTKLKRSFAVADIAVLASDAESEHALWESNDEYEPQSELESQAHEDLPKELDEPTPKKRQKTMKVPVREAINANRKEHKPHKAENKVSRF
jgi:hypothetical protein